eukprot:Rhum_TRINITY_DN23105_c0_g1::Rhum_TRINITY_DN23105_c0_g1_i1::g.177144::m.177144
MLLSNYRKGGEDEQQPQAVQHLTDVDQNGEVKGLCENQRHNRVHEDGVDRRVILRVLLQQKLVHPLRKHPHRGKPTQGARRCAQKRSHEAEAGNGTSGHHHDSEEVTPSLLTQRHPVPLLPQGWILALYRQCRACCNGQDVHCLRQQQEERKALDHVATRRVNLFHDVPCTVETGDVPAQKGEEPAPVHRRRRVGHQLRQLQVRRPKEEEKQERRGGENSECKPEVAHQVNAENVHRRGATNDNCLRDESRHRCRRRAPRKQVRHQQIRVQRVVNEVRESRAQDEGKSHPLRERTVHPHAGSGVRRDRGCELRNHERRGKPPHPGNHQHAEDRSKPAAAVDALFDAVGAAHRGDEQHAHNLPHGEVAFVLFLVLGMKHAAHRAGVSALFGAGEDLPIKMGGLRHPRRLHTLRYARCRGIRVVHQ